MSDLTSSLTPRPVPSPDAAGRVVGRVSSATDNTKQQQQTSGGQPQQSGEEETAARSGHHDPAVTLSATIVHLEVGAVIDATVRDRDADQRPFIEANGALYLVEASPRLLQLLRPTVDISLKVTAVDRTIAAEIIALDDTPLSTPLAVTLTVVKVDPAKLPPVADAPAADAVIATYRPSAAYIPPSDGEEAPYIPQSAIPSAPAPKQPPLPAFLTASPRAGFAPLVENAAPTPTLPVPNAASAAPPIAQDKVSAAPPPLPGLPTLPLPFTFDSLLLPLTPPPGARAYTAETAKTAPVTVSILELRAPSPEPVMPESAPPTAVSSPTPTLKPEIHANPLPHNPLAIAGIVTRPTTPGPAHAVIATPQGNIALPQGLHLPIGAKVTLTLHRPAQHQAEATATPAVETPAAVAPIPSSAPPPVLTAAVAPLTPFPPLSDALPEPFAPWPVFEAMAVTLQQHNPELAAAMMSKLPSPQRLLTPALLLFMNLIGVRSPAQLLLGTDTQSALKESGREDIKKAAETTVERLKSIVADRPPTEWRPYPLPLLTERGVEMLVLLVRQSGEDPRQNPAGQEGSDSESPTDHPQVTRFVLDIPIGSLGLTQIDGIIKQRTFNLALRSEYGLNTREQQDIRTLFLAALERNQFTGDINFRTGLPFPVNSTAEWHSAARQAKPLTA